MTKPVVLPAVLLSLAVAGAFAGPTPVLAAVAASPAAVEAGGAMPIVALFLAQSEARVPERLASFEEGLVLNTGLSFEPPRTRCQSESACAGPIFWDDSKQDCS